MPEVSDHDLLIELRVKLDGLLDQSRQQHLETARQFAALDQRVNVIEGWKDNLMGKLAAVIIVGGVALFILEQLIAKWIAKI